MTTNGSTLQRVESVAHTCVFVDRWPEEAFGAFVEEVGMGFDGVDWWWIRPDRGRYLRFGRLHDSLVVEAWDAIGAERLRIGDITVWQPDARLCFDWRQDDWPDAGSTTVDVAFEPLFGGTLMTIEHAGFEFLGPAAGRVAREYTRAWTNSLHWVAARASGAARG